MQLDSNPILEKDLLDDKVGILDIKAKIDNEANCDIEMQVVDRKNIEKRILFYWSKMYNMSIKEGEDYSTLEKGIVILISDYELESLKEIEKYITKWNIREEEYQKQDGTIGVSVKPYTFRTMGDFKAGKIQIPKKKEIQKSMTDDMVPVYGDTMPF